MPAVQAVVIVIIVLAEIHIKVNGTSVTLNAVYEHLEAVIVAVQRANSSEAVGKVIHLAFGSKLYVEDRTVTCKRSCRIIADSVFICIVNRRCCVPVDKIRYCFFYLACTAVLVYIEFAVSIGNITGVFVKCADLAVKIGRRRFVCSDIAVIAVAYHLVVSVAGRLVIGVKCIVGHIQLSTAACHDA